MSSVLSIEAATDLNTSIDVFLSNIRLDTNNNKIVLTDLFNVFKLSKTNSNNYYVRLNKKYPQLFVNMEILRVNNQGNKLRVIDIPSAIEIIWVLPGDFAESFRRKSANYLTRMMAGDRTLINEIEIRHERVSPELRDVLMTHVETPVSQQVSVIELQNIINRQATDLDSNKNQLTTALLTIDELKSTVGDLKIRNIKLEQKKEKTIQLAKEWHSDCEIKLQRKIQPSDKLTNGLANELVNYMNIEYENKIEELEQEAYVDKTVENLSNQLSVCKIALKKTTKKFNGDFTELLKDITIERCIELKMEYEDSIECYIEKLKKIEKECLEYKMSNIQCHTAVADLKKKLEEVNDLRDINTGLQCTLKNMTRDKENAKEEYTLLNDKYKLLKRTKTESKVVHEMNDKEAYNNRVRLIGNLWPELEQSKM